MTGASKAVNEPRGGPKGDRDGETLKSLVCQSVFTFTKSSLPNWDNNENATELNKLLLLLLF